MARQADSRAEQLAPISRVKAAAHAVDTFSSVADGGIVDKVGAPRVSEAIGASPVSGVGPRALKRTLDVVGSVALAVLFAPLVIVASLVLARTGPVIYRHKRVSQGGKVFECLKFRTMIPDADRVLHELLATDDQLKAEWRQSHKLRDDPRVTPIGRFLRRTSLDELPQLWNVLRGEMSLVGPRPITREELLRYGRSSAAYLSAKPGITGLWQISGRNDTDYGRRIALDVYYVRNRNLLLDLYILTKTVRVVVSGDGAY